MPDPGARNRHSIDLVNVIAANRDPEALVTPPYGILYVGSALKRAGYAVRLHHIHPDEMGRTAAAVAERAPLFVGVSTFTGVSIRRAAEFSRFIKKMRPAMPVVWGGIHATLTAEECLELDCVDIVVLGEGEHTAVELADGLAGQGDIAAVAGICHKSGGAPARTTDRPLTRNLDDLVLDWSLVDRARYVSRLPDGRRMFDLIASRGCPCNCGFCYNAHFHRRRWRAHSTRHVLELVAELRDAHDITDISSDDDNFFVDRRRALELVEGFARLGVRLSRADIHLHDVAADSVARLRDLGVRQLFTGWESGSDRMLALIGKRFTAAEVLEKTRLLARFPEIQFKASAMICLPTETREETLATLRTMVEMLDIHPNICFNMGVYVPFPGTPLYPVALSEGFVPPKKPEEWDEFSQFSTALPITWIPWLTDADRAMIRGVLLYHPYLERRPRRPGESFIKYTLQQGFRAIVRLRFRHLFFRFRFEFALFRLLREVNRRTFRW